MDGARERAMRCGARARARSVRAVRACGATHLSGQAAAKAEPSQLAACRARQSESVRCTARKRASSLRSHEAANELELCVQAA
eukprot:5051528-Pleurochrysis_carterae.AAC.2